MVKSLSAKIDETNKNIDEPAKRIDPLQTTLLEIQY
jgi:peptidoglycan hydrolase CwlO-like protein